MYIHMPDQTLAERLDDLMWTFRQNSFVPHALLPVGPEDRSPILIGWREPPQSATQVLINLTDQVPEFFQNFDRVLEVVDQEPEVLQHSRTRFKHYREQGLKPGAHKL